MVPEIGGDEAWSPAEGLPLAEQHRETLSYIMHLKITFPLPLQIYYLVYGLSRPLIGFLSHPRPAHYHFNDCKHSNQGSSLNES